MKDGGGRGPVAAREDMADEQKNGAAPEEEPKQEAPSEQPAAAASGDGAEPAAEGAAAMPAPTNPNMKWYIIHTYSGFERKVRESLESRVVAFGLQGKIGRVVIPTEPLTEIRGGKKYTVERMF